MMRARSVIEPNLERHARYGEWYALYRELYARVKPLYEKLNPAPGAP